MSELKKLLVLFGGRDDELHALEAAFSLAQTFTAQVEVVHVSPDPKTFLAACYSGMGVPAPSFESLRDDIEKLNATNQKAARDKFEEVAKKSRMDVEEQLMHPHRASSYFSTEIGDAEDITAIKGRLADLIIMSRTIREVNADYNNAIIAGLFNTGRPVLLTPPDDIQKDIDLKVVVAWNGSAQAARAVASAMPLLRRAANATKVWVLTEGETDFPIPAEQLCLYLKQHNIEAEVREIKDKGLTTPVAILAEAKYLQAGMIVMGAFSHSRMQEMILGGVTQFMLENADIPLLMSH